MTTLRKPEANTIQEMNKGKRPAFKQGKLSLVYLSVVTLLVALAVGAHSFITTAQQQTPELGSRKDVLTGARALGDWTTDAPGVRRRLTVADLPQPYDTPSVR